jgi:hypothetical protein
MGLLPWLLALPGKKPALAWGDVGHRIISEIAFKEMNERTRERPTEQLCAQGL